MSSIQAFPIWVFQHLEIVDDIDDRVCLGGGQGIAVRIRGLLS